MESIVKHSLSWNLLYFDLNIVYRRKRNIYLGRTFLGVTNAWDHPYVISIVTSQTLPPLFKTVRAKLKRSPETPAKSAKKSPPKQNYKTCHLPQNTEQNSFQTTSMCQVIHRFVLGHHDTDCFVWIHVFCFYLKWCKAYNHVVHTLFCLFEALISVMLLVSVIKFLQWTWFWFKTSHQNDLHEQIPAELRENVFFWVNSSFISKYQTCRKATIVNGIIRYH